MTSEVCRSPGHRPMAQSINSAEFKALCTHTNKPSAAKQVSHGVLKIMMSSGKLYYITDGNTVRKLLSQYGLNP